MKSKLKEYLLYISLAIVGAILLFIVLQTVRAKNTGFETKTLWDWMELLIIPIFLALGAFFLNRSERVIERQRAEERAKLEREIATDRQREAALQSYLDGMADLLLKEKLKVSKKAEVQDVARIRTLTLLRILDKRRKGLVLKFLQESGLIDAKKSIINLTDADLRGAELIGANLKGVNLEGVDLDNAFLPHCFFDGAQLSGISLVNANLSGAVLTDADVSNSSLSKADLSEAYFSNTNLLNTDLTETNLKNAIMNNANLNCAILTKANLTESHLDEANLVNAEMNDADLTEAHLYGADLTGANLTKSNLTGADLRNTQLTRFLDVDNQDLFEGTSLIGAILRGADLTDANMESADLTGADLTKAKVSVEQLATVKSLKGAIMPDGTKHD